MTARVKPFNPNHIFVDTNVIIGAYCQEAEMQDTCHQ
jgi:hypothetical protein